MNNRTEVENKKEEKMSKETETKVKNQKELIEQELITLTDQKAKMVTQVNQLQLVIKTSEERLQRAIDVHNRTQAQIDILQKVLG